MYRIGEILEQALLLHDCVVLPTIGAFIVEHTPPLYDEALNVITPAGQRISFNAALVSRDGILDTLYAQTLGLSVRRARLVVDSDVTVIRHHLYETGSLTLGTSIGTITLQESGELLFLPTQEQKGLRSIHSYGLYPQGCLLPVVKLSTSIETESIRQKPADRKYWTIRVNRTATNWAAAVVICLLCLLPIGSDRQTDRYSAGFVPYGWLDDSARVTEEVAQPSETKAELTENNSSVEVEHSLEAATESLQSVVKASTTPQLLLTHAEAAERGSHVVVVAVFKSKSRAQQFIDEAIAGDRLVAGETLQVVQESSRCLVIAGGICSSQEQAGELRQRISSQSESFSGAWVYAL